jgi:hypothetical protein
MREFAFGEDVRSSSLKLTPLARRYVHPSPTIGFLTLPNSVLEAYAAGVNAYMTTHARPWEFVVAGCKFTFCTAKAGCSSSQSTLLLGHQRTASPSSRLCRIWYAICVAPFQLADRTLQGLTDTQVTAQPLCLSTHSD